jgi:ankyrin repeat protein
VVKLLLEAGAVDSFVGDIGKSALHRAIDGASVDACRVLVSHGVSPSVCYAGAPRDYMTPMQYAICFDKESIVRFFVDECGVSLEQTTLNGRTTDVLMAKSPCVAAFVRSIEMQEGVAAAIGESAGAEAAPSALPSFNCL